MSRVFLALDEEETMYPEACDFQSGLTVRSDDSSVGVGFVLRDAEGKPLAGFSMTADQAMQHASYLLEVALKLNAYR